MTTSNNVSAALRQIYQLIKTGDKPQAKKLLAEFLKANPQNADGWYLASLLTDNPNAKMQALERALAINPHHKAATGALMKLWPDAPEQTSDDPFAAPPVADSGSALIATATSVPASQGNRQPIKLSKRFVLGSIAVGAVVLIGAILVLSGSFNRLFVAMNPTATATHTATSTATATFTAMPVMQAATFTPSATATLRPTATPSSTGTPTTTPFFRIGPTLPPSKTPLPAAIEDPIMRFEFNVIDAEYSKTLDRIVMISSDPNQLHIFDPATDKDVVIDLEKVPLAVSVKPDGDVAVVGHDKLISYIDLRVATIIKTMSVPFMVTDIALDRNNYAYTASNDFIPWVIDLDNYALLPVERNLGGYDAIRRDNRFKLHPGGQYMYGVLEGNLYKLEIGSKPKRIGWGVRGSTVPVCGDLWFSEDGKRIFTQCGAVYRSSEDAGQDMSYNGSLKRNVYGVIHTHNAGKIIALSDAEGGTGGNNIRTAQHQLLAIYNYEDLQEVDTFLLPKFVSAPANGQFIFLNSNETDYYVIVRADKESGLLHDFGLVKRSLGEHEVAMNSTTTSAPTVTLTPRITRTPVPTATQTLTPSITFTPLPTRTFLPTYTPTITPQPLQQEIIPFHFRVIDAEYSKTLNRLVMISDSPNQLHIYNPTNDKDVVVDLSATSICVSISPNGKLAAIGHDKQLSLIDLQTAKVIKTFETNVKTVDVVLAGNGFAYVSGFMDTSNSVSIWGIKIDTGDILPIKADFRQRGLMRLHPEGDRLYLLNGWMTRISIRAGQPSEPSPQSINGENCDNLWLSEDGKRIFTGCGIVLRASPDTKLDMTSNGFISFSGQRFFTWIAHAAKTGQLLALPKGDYGYLDRPNPPQSQVVLFDYDTLTLQTAFTLPRFTAAEKTFLSKGRFVFINANGKDYYVIVQADERSGLLNDFGLVKSTITASKRKP